MQQQNESQEFAREQSMCEFCTLDSITDYVLKETPSFRIVADHAPLLQGHTLIIPRQHYACYGAVPAELDAELIALKDEMRRFFSQFYDTAVFWEHGVFRQTVFHAHLHCFPIGDAEYPLSETPHSSLISGQDNIRAWYRTQGHYFYLEDSQRTLLFSPEMEDYLYIIQHVLAPRVIARTHNTSWRSSEQRQIEGKPLIAALQAKWKFFQQQREGEISA